MTFFSCQFFSINPSFLSILNGISEILIIRGKHHNPLSCFWTWKYFFLSCLYSSLDEFERNESVFVACSKTKRFSMQISESYWSFSFPTCSLVTTEILFWGCSSVVSFALQFLFKNVFYLHTECSVTCLTCIICMYDCRFVISSIFLKGRRGDKKKRCYMYTFFCWRCLNKKRIYFSLDFTLVCSFDDMVCGLTCQALPKKGK